MLKNIMTKEVILIIISSVFLFLLSFHQTSAKDYSIPEVDIEVNLQKDGSAWIKESRTYKFDGSFSWADEWINLKVKYSGCKNYKISNFSLEDEKGYYLKSSLTTPPKLLHNRGKDKFYIKWFYSAFDESKNFTMRYKVQNAITNHPDTAEFYWQLIGNEWDRK
jgi:Predicted membrane protein (DUF2207).